MAEPFLGEIRMFAGDFPPRGWAFCDGQLLDISQNDALFSLFGTTYGGDGRTTFGLPDLRGRIPIHAGQGPDLSARPLGSHGGTETVTLSANQIPAHTHPFQASIDRADLTSPRDAVLSQSALLDSYVQREASVGLSAKAVQATGGGQSHSNLQPFLCIHFIVALVGIYPSRA